MSEVDCKYHGHLLDRAYEEIESLRAQIAEKERECDQLRVARDGAMAFLRYRKDAERERDEARAALEKWTPASTHDSMHHAHIRAPIGEDWHSVLHALVAASAAMRDFEDTKHRVDIAGESYAVDLDAENGNPPNVYEVRAALGGEG